MSRENPFSVSTGDKAHIIITVAKGDARKNICQNHAKTIYVEESSKWLTRQLSLKDNIGSGDS